MDLLEPGITGALTTGSQEDFYPPVRIRTDCPPVRIRDPLPARNTANPRKTAKRRKKKKIAKFAGKAFRHIVQATATVIARAAIVGAAIVAYGTLACVLATVAPAPLALGIATGVFAFGIISTAALPADKREMFLQQNHAPPQQTNGAAYKEPSPLTHEFQAAQQARWQKDNASQRAEQEAALQRQQQNALINRQNYYYTNYDDNDNSF